MRRFFFQENIAKYILGVRGKGQEDLWDGKGENEFTEGGKKGPDGRFQDECFHFELTSGTLYLKKSTIFIEKIIVLNGRGSGMDILLVVILSALQQNIDV